MQALWQDTKFALRRLRNSPGFAFTVAVTLALGVGANVVVFSVIDTLVLRPLPVPTPDRIVALNRINGHDEQPYQSYPDYRDLRNGNSTFSGLAAYSVNRLAVGNSTEATSGDVRQSWVYEASENYFDVLQAQPALGRFFHASDAHGPNSMPYAVLSYGYWQDQFHGDVNIVGKVVALNKHPFTVLGVAPKDFYGTENFVYFDLWVPLIDQEMLDGRSPLEDRGAHSFAAFGRLKPGVGRAEAEADLNTVAGRLGRQYRDDEKLALHLSPPGLMGDFLGKPVRGFLAGVMALAALVLFAACANLGGLFAARAADRARELALRVALGARRMVLVRQLLTEALCISLIGGALSLLVANVAMRALAQWRISDFPLRLNLHADARIFIVALVLSVGSGLFFGLVPLRQVWRGSAYLLIKSGHEGIRGTHRWTLRDILLVAQIALCSVLVTSSLVAVRGLERSLHAPYGFQPKDAMLATFDLQMAGYKDDAVLPMKRRAIDAVAATPGVTAVGMTDALPLNFPPAHYVFREGTSDFRESNQAAIASVMHVSPGYLQAAQTRLLAGRDFTWHDDRHSPNVAVVNEAFARQVFATGNATSLAIGRHFLRESGKPWEVIGIVQDGKYDYLTEEPSPAMFLATAQTPGSSTTLVVRTRKNSSAIAAAVHDALRTLDPALAISIQDWASSLSFALFPSVAASMALGGMGGLAAMLAITGIFGMASYSVSKRMRELGLRVALGAQRKQILSTALGRPARLLLIGSLIGIGLGVLASRVLAYVVYQATPQDPIVLAGVVLSMALIAFAATLLPARRVLHVDPAALLREE